MLQFITKAYQQRGIRYILIGFWNTIFAFAVLVILKFTTMPPLNTIEVVTITSLISIIQSYIMQRKFVWKSNSEIRKEFPKFIVIAGGQNISSILLIIYFVNYKKFPLLPAQFVITLMLFGITFLFMRSWTFATKEKHIKKD